LLKPTPEWGPAHKIAQFDIEDVHEVGDLADENKTISNPNFTGNLMSNPFDSQI
jgi:hypothetical protein